MKNEIIPRVYIAPYIIIEKIKYLISKHGINEFLTKRIFKKIREMYVAACYLMGLGFLDGNLYWISTENSEAPDVIAARFENDEIGRKEWKIDIEVMTWTKYDKRTLARTIIDKLSKKAYPKNFKLVCYIEKTNSDFVPEFVYRELSGLTLNIGEIYLLAETGINNKGHVLFEVYPNKKFINFDLEKEVEKSKQKYPAPFVKTSRGLGNNFTDLGKGFYSYEVDREDVEKIN